VELPGAHAIEKLPDARNHGGTKLLPVVVGEDGILRAEPEVGVVELLAIHSGVAPLRSADGPAIACVTLLEGPPGIQSQRDVDGIVGPMTRAKLAL